MVGGVGWLARGYTAVGDLGRALYFLMLGEDILEVSRGYGFAAFSWCSRVERVVSSDIRQERGYTHTVLTVYGCCLVVYSAKQQQPSSVRTFPFPTKLPLISYSPVRTLSDSL